MAETVETDGVVGGECVERGIDMSGALSLAWKLMESGALSEEDYSGMVQDLSEMAAEQSVATVSVLHVLEARGVKNIGQIMGAIANEYGTPIISLAGFDLQLQAVSSLPYETMVRCGTMPFEFMGSNALVVTMNPYDERLREETEQTLKRKCHFFITLPSEFDQALERVATLMDESSRSEGE